MTRLRSITTVLAAALLLAACDGATDDAPSPDGEEGLAGEETTETGAPIEPREPDVSAEIDAVDVQPVDRAEADGVLVMRTEADTVRLRLSMTGLEEGTRYLPNVHEGRCGGEMGPAVGSLAPFTGGGDDMVTTTGAIPASKLAADRSYFVEVHGLGTAACANLP